VNYKYQNTTNAVSELLSLLDNDWFANEATVVHVLNQSSVTARVKHQVCSLTEYSVKS
jgi:hypothetical protein